MLKHFFNFTSSTGIYKYAKVLGIKKDTNPISIERRTVIQRYTFITKFITNSEIQELRFYIILDSESGNINYKILTVDIPEDYFQHLPIIVSTDNGCDIYLCTLSKTGLASIELEEGDANNLILYPVGQANISEQDAFALENQIIPTFQTSKIQAQNPIEITTTYGKILILDLKNGTYLFKFIGNENITSEHTIITTLPTEWRPRINLNVWTTSLSKPNSNDIGNIKIFSDGNVDANIPTSYLVGQMIIVK